MKRIDIYDYPRRLKAMQRKLAAASISQQDKDLIEKFQADGVLEGIGVARMMRYIGVLIFCSETMPCTLEAAGKEEIKGLVRTIEGREDWAAWTKNTYKTMIKRFFRWLRQSGRQSPEEVAWINTSIKITDQKLPTEGELITETDVAALLKHAMHPRDRALISTLYESGARIGEIAGLRISNVEFDKYGAVLHVTGKTGPRPIRVVASVPYLATWLQHHPNHDDPRAPYWVLVGTRNHGQPMTYCSIKKVLASAFKAANIKKRYNPHFFRHSRATFLANHLTEFQMNQYFGWIQGSDMPATYVHMSGKNLDASILQLNGKSAPKDDAIASPLSPTSCPRCTMVNAHGNHHCSRCGAPMDVVSALQVEATGQQNEQADTLMHALLADPEIRTAIKAKIKQLAP